MAEEEQILNRMEYHTYKILKEQNDQFKNDIANNSLQIANLNKELEQLQQSNIQFPGILSNQDQEMIRIEEEIRQIRIRDDAQIFQLRDQLSQFEQRYSQQEKKNEFQQSQHQIREPNRFFSDISKPIDGIQSIKVILDAHFNIQQIKQEIQQNTLNIIAILVSQEVSHVIYKQHQLDSQNQLQGIVVQNHEVTYQIG
ncbi:unnamed protein product [Paramecium sonneborni]|uniref:Uncharacterized protein n=1 Tax=Paramecium sonneborni TaxID=65129 RepID=A0A8S1QZL4_9CILI|nr:unnamed protein product [Paramecium sonneborni]